MFFAMAIGIAGMLFVLSAFVLEDLGKIERGGMAFNFCNLFGSILLFVYAYISDVLIFEVLNGIWAIFAVYFIVRRDRESKLAATK